MKYSRLVPALLFAGALLGGSLVAQQKEISFESAGDFLKLPADIHLGEVAGVATTSTGNLWVYYQGGGSNAIIGASRVYIAGGARLLEFDRSGKFLREIGTSENERPYAFLFAQGVRVDPQDNVWIVDRASRMVVKFDRSGKVLLTLGRRLEAVGDSAAVASSAVRQGLRALVSAATISTSPPMWPGTRPATSSSPTGMATPASPSSTRTGSSSSPGGRPGPNRASSILRTPSPSMPAATSTSPTWAISGFRCSTTTARSRARSRTWARRVPSASRPARSSFSTAPTPTRPRTRSSGEIYKMELDGTVLGRIGRAGKQFKEFGMVNGIDCRDPNTLYVAELMNWRCKSSA